MPNKLMDKPLSEQTVLGFFQRQLDSWPEVEQRFSDVANHLLLKTLSCGENVLTVQCNPQRIRSTTARVDKQSLTQRPCFLCDANRPTEQQSLCVDDLYHILVNPYPILPRHLTIPTLIHQPQSLGVLLPFFRQYVPYLPHFLFFYNGPFCGASAPDHAHLQAVARGYLPIEQDWETYAANLQAIIPGISLLTNFVCPAFVIQLTREDQDWHGLQILLNALPRREGMSEPDFNLLAWSQEEDNVILVLIPRSRHRPACYFASDYTQLLISPGALDMGGILVAPRQADFDRLTASKAEAILREVSLSPRQTQQTVDNIYSQYS